LAYKIDDTRLAWSCTVDGCISLPYAAGEDDPTQLAADLFPAHKRDGYEKKTAEKIMDDDNRDRDIAIFIITHMLNTCRALIIQRLDAKNILPSVFKRMGLVDVILSDKMIKHLVLSRITCVVEPNTALKLTSPHILLSTKIRGRPASFLCVRRSEQVLLGPNMNSNFGRELFIFWVASF